MADSQQFLTDAAEEAGQNLAPTATPMTIRRCARCQQLMVAICESAWGPGANTHDKPLKFLRLARSMDGAELHLVASFARSISGERSAAIQEPWSNGQTEGQVTKLKLVKRQRYGRAKIDLIEAGLIGAA